MSGCDFRFVSQDCAVECQNPSDCVCYLLISPELVAELKAQAVEPQINGIDNA